ncbi:MAG: hypothetical protein COA36_03385 [Desulfotalea sp.]|nr:MAG: hypothetical protein COA36_03385 [Desulfotalea sp.]
MKNQGSNLGHNYGLSKKNSGAVFTVTTTLAIPGIITGKEILGRKVEEHPGCFYGNYVSEMSTVENAFILLVLPQRKGTRYSKNKKGYQFMQRLVTGLVDFSIKSSYLKKSQRKNRLATIGVMELKDFLQKRI